jgi:hypothetical protein
MKLAYLDVAVETRDPGHIDGLLNRLTERGFSTRRLLDADKVG